MTCCGRAWIEERENPKFEIRHEVKPALTTKQIQMTKAQNTKQYDFEDLTFINL